MTLSTEITLVGGIVMGTVSGWVAWRDSVNEANTQIGNTLVEVSKPPKILPPRQPNVREQNLKDSSSYDLPSP